MRTPKLIIRHEYSRRSFFHEVAFIPRCGKMLLLCYEDEIIFSIFSASILNLGTAFAQGTIYDTLGPSNVFNPGIASSILGWNFVGHAPLAGGFRFSAADSANVLSYDLPLSSGIIGGPPSQMYLELRMDVAGRPDFSSSGLLDTASIIYDANVAVRNGSSNNTPALTQGTYYWLLAHKEDDQYGLWYTRTLPAGDLEEYFYPDLNNPSSGYYYPVNYSEDSAFRINSVPEPNPSVYLIMVVGFAILSEKRGRRRNCAI